MKPRILILLLCYAICITTACKKEADVKPVKSSVKVSDDGGDAKTSESGDGG